MTYTIDPELCLECGICASECPEGAIFKEEFECPRCGAAAQTPGYVCQQCEEELDEEARKK